MGYEEAVILVVGTASEYKSKVADAVAEGRNASEVEIGQNGVRMFSNRSSDKLSVVETVPLITYPGWSILDNARQWIARNSLKKLFGKLIFVLCVASSSGPHDDIYQDPDFLNNKFSWLNLLAFIFNEHQRSIMMLVKLHGNHDSGATKEGMRNILQRDGFETSNIMFAKERRRDIIPPINRALEFSVSRRGDSSLVRATLGPFHLKEVTMGASDADRLGPWGPDRIILLGRSGSGKSTLAEMLISGKLDPDSQHFVSSSSIRGETKDVTHGEGRGWYVVDTPGFGEPKDKYSTVCSEDAETKIKKYVQLIEGTYTHFIHVMMKDRIDELEVNLWKFFLLLFGKDIKDNFSIVISNANQNWVDDNMKDLQKTFEGCDSFLSAEFPPVPADDQEWEEELRQVREEALKNLEDGLTVLYRCHTYCDFGQYSKMNIKREIAELGLATRDTKSWRRKAPMALRALAKETCSDFHRLALTLKMDNQIVLLQL